MKNKILFLLFFAVISTLISCEKDEERIYLDENLNPPELIEVPSDLVLNRVNSGDTIMFAGTLIDPGFASVIRYQLLAERIPGEEPALLFSDSQDTVMKVSVADLNTALLNICPEYTSSVVNLMIAAELIADAGTGADKIIYYSAPRTINVTTFGVLRIDVIDSDTIQQLAFTEVDGVFSGAIVLDISMPFTLVNPETGTTYGGSDGTLVVDGPAIVPAVSGDYTLTVNTNDMTYVLSRGSNAVMKLIDSGIDQSINTGEGAGVFTGVVIMDAAQSFTLLDDETNTSYGGSDGTLTIGGDAITPPGDGTHLLTVSTTDLTYELVPYSVGVVGAFNGWAAPDIPMNYDAAEGVWTVTMDLPEGPMKFRVNEAWTDRWGPGTNSDLPGVGGTMVLPNGDADINITAAGNYDIELTITGFTDATNLAAVAVFTLN